jgi:prepilin-type N-terminal cleavage/methylation domain-containing protein
MAALPRTDLISVKLRKKDCESGFTLVEIIITIVIVAFVVTMIMVYFGTGITHSSDPIARLNSEALLAQVMEKITLQYTQYPRWQPNTNYPANSMVIPATPITRNGYLYTTTAGGRSGSVEPLWNATTPPGTSPLTGTDGTVTWIWAASCAPDLDGTCPNTLAANNSHNCNCPTGLQALIGTEGGTGNSTFGNFGVIQNHFITFNSAGNEVAVNYTTPFLKVTIGPPANTLTSQQLATLFVRR